MKVFYGFGGFLVGFAVPILLGLYSCNSKNFKLADYSLKVLFFWTLTNQLFAAPLKWLFDHVSQSFWSLAYTAYPVALLVPKTNLLKTFDEYTVLFFDSGSLGFVKKQLKKACVFSRRALASGVKKLQDKMTF
ncbi:conserved hypothetical protein [Theileria orientalis strain Shintoku]|uniref:Uncharacterized protein n=1 Tax=Theileria orientalis strain Shintoku TaxID=869250 RepID=J4CDC1_THEOR|nr:conserved hypothetical protein [Theileria orientalis strain Shintoku]BAM40882.1 conserved hypothetical protein [Theileria orientalis strain Shintoku]|eukprot:XP_009691183.1 conserved hypothetical protein [Theileria orientalis strain Shintoku]